MLSCIIFPTFPVITILQS
ncbi:hypothetical protein [Plasmodium yoelii yoelii]|uniref:Uncharacterized protein n=1 Tax=Plasmodium yoelii yoelii TaxID=73239 RepID=Q7RAU4_PLAYO|nr:hypothetical protein [Plasmodium yoelii yoelii]